MAYSGQEFREKYTSIEDADIIAVVMIAEQMSGLSKKASELVTDWLHQMQVSGPGTIDLKLDDHLHSDDDVNDFLGLLNLVRNKIRAYGDVIPANVLNERAGSVAMGITFVDYQSQLIMSVLDKLEALVT